MLATISFCVTVIIGGFLILLLYWYSVRNHDFWIKRGIRQTKTVPVLGSMYETLKKPLHDVQLKLSKEHGAVYGYYEMQNPILSVADPSLLRDILVKDIHTFTNRRTFYLNNKVFDGMLVLAQGEDWKRIRTIISPTFSTGKIKRMLSIFKDCSTTAIINLKKETKSSESVEIKRIFGAYTMDVIACSAFSTKLDSHNDPDNDFIKKAKIFFTGTFTWRTLLFMLCPGICRYLKMQVFPLDVVEFFKTITMQIIEERKKSGHVRNDFLQLLLDTAIEVDGKETETVEKEVFDVTSNYKNHGTNSHIFNTVTSKNLSMDELVAQCVIFFLAGYDATASTLAFATYLLALNPNIQNKLRAEVDEELRKTDGEIIYESIQNMKYMDNVISETLRLYPPTVRLERVAGEPYTLADHGITLDKGTIITVPVYALHRDPQYFPDPERFDPDRFNPEEKIKRNPYVYLPFGAGPRNCVAMRFALIEIKVLLAEVINSFVINTSSKTEVNLEYTKTRSTLQPKSIQLNFELRKDARILK